MHPQTGEKRKKGKINTLINKLHHYSHIKKAICHSLEQIANVLAHLYHLRTIFCWLIAFLVDQNVSVEYSLTVMMLFFICCSLFFFRFTFYLWYFVALCVCIYSFVCLFLSFLLMFCFLFYLVYHFSECLWPTATPNSMCTDSQTLSCPI